MNDIQEQIRVKELNLAVARNISTLLPDERWQVLAAEFEQRRQTVASNLATVEYTPYKTGYYHGFYRALSLLVQKADENQRTILSLQSELDVLKKNRTLANGMSGTDLPQAIKDELMALDQQLNQYKENDDG